MRLSQQLLEATEMGMEPVDDAGLIIKVVRLSSEAYPGRDANGILPILVVGHEAMSEAAWKGWVRRIGYAHYGPGYVDRVLSHGVDLKEMEPTRPFGRQIRVQTEGTWKSRAHRWKYLDAVNAIVSVVEKWPSLYNVIAENMVDEVMTLREFVARVSELPNPMADGRRVYSTLGDIIDGPIGTKPMVFPDY